MREIYNLISFFFIPPNSNAFLEENVSRVGGQKSLTPWGEQNSLTP